mgnify:CR=1 FL=1
MGRPFFHGSCHWLALRNEYFSQEEAGSLRGFFLMKILFRALSAGALVAWEWP